MPSQFFGLTIAHSGLQSYQTAVNTTANNISNVDTEGYTRQQAILEAADALRVTAKYGSAGTGVEVTQIKQLRNVYYDMKYWNNECKLGNQETKVSYLKQIEDYFRDDETTTGFTTIFGNMYDALDTLKTDSASLTTRNSYISSAKTLAEYFNSVTAQLSELQSEINEVIASQVDDINSIAQKIASLTKQINIIEMQKGHANELRDDRNLLIDKLSKMVPVEVTETDVVNTNFPEMDTGATNYIVKIDGQVLVSTYEYNQLVCVPRSENQKVNTSDGEGLYDIYWAENPSTMQPSSRKFETTNNTMSGSIKALFELRDGNNNNAFSGVVADAEKVIGGYQVTIKDPSITDPNEMTMPETGIININNVEYRYSSYTLVEDYNGITGEKSYSYQFMLQRQADESPIIINELQKSVNQPATIGKSIDFMGIAYYQSQLDTFVRNFSQAYNEMVENNNGVNLKGETANYFFVANDLVNSGEYDYTQHLSKSTTPDANGSYTVKYDSAFYYHYMNAKNFTVCAEAIKDPSTIATASKEEFADGVDAYDIAEKLKTLKSDVAIFRGGAASDFLQCLVTDTAVDTEKATTFNKTYSNLQTAISNQRMSEASVDSDEEALNLVKFQNAYNLSSKVVSVLQEIYNQLILNTGA